MARTRQQVIESLARRGQQRDRAHSVAITTPIKFTEEIRRLSAVQRLAKRRHDKDKRSVLSDQLNQAARRGEVTRLTGWRGCLLGKDGRSTAMACRLACLSVFSSRASSLSVASDIEIGCGEKLTCVSRPVAVDQNTFVQVEWSIPSWIWLHAVCNDDQAITLL